jgi:hypothetical protein
MGTLPVTGHQHHERIRSHIDQVPALADMLEARPLPAAFRPAFEAQLAFLEGTLLPHIEVVETSVYQELERLMQNRHSMTPMRREHDELTGLARTLGAYRRTLDAGSLSMSEAMSLRRVLYRLFALVKVHLAEEAEYLRLLEGSLSPEEQDALAEGLEHAVARPL